MSKMLFKNLSLSALLALVLASSAFALPTLTVDTTVDEADGDCLDGDCSLRDAVATIDVNGTITLPAGNYQLSLGEIAVVQQMTIEGAGARVTTIDANAASRILRINNAYITVSGLTLTDGAVSASETGGAVLIENDAGLQLLSCTVSNSTAGAGGGIGSLVDEEPTSLQALDSTFTGNSAVDGYGGAIGIPFGQLVLINSTVSGNSASAGGGGIAVDGAFGLVGFAFTTIVDNEGGGIFSSTGILITLGTILDGNTPSNCEVPFFGVTYSNLSSDASCPFVGPDDLSNVASLALPLANNGGPTDTHALPMNSPAVDSALCDEGYPAEVDQRAVLRPQGASCDRGAFELEQAATSTLCTTQDFSSELGPLSLSNVGDADQGDATVVGGKVQLTADGSAFYHGTDNGAFLHQSVTGDFRVEVQLEGFPVNAGGGYRRSGLTVRTGTGPNDPRVFVEFLPQHPTYLQSALMFDYRGMDGVAKELASTKLGLAVPTRLAIDRRGDKFTVWYSTDGINWVKPAGAAGGSITIAIPATVEVGLMSASYDTSVTLTSEFDNFEVCRPNPEPLPALPEPVACQAGQPLDVVYLLDTSGSARSNFPGGPTNLDAARQAVEEMNDLIEANLPGSRAAAIAYKGGPAPAYTTGTGATVLSSLTSSFGAVESAAAAINVLAINPSTSSTLSQALAAARQMLVAGAQPGSRPVVVVFGDGFVNVDFNGNGPLSYKTAEMAAISIISGLDYLTVGEAGWLGNWNGPIGTWDGEALSNAMAQGLLLKEVVPNVGVFTFGLHGVGPYRMDLLGFLADYTGGTYSDTTDMVSLSSAVSTTYSSSLGCTP